MPTRGRFPRFLGLFVLALSFVGIISFQIFKERRIAHAAIAEKDSQLLEIENSFKEQVKVASQREEERNFAQTKLVELERVSQTALDSLHAKDEELENIKLEHQKVIDEMKVLKQVVEQKEVEIVDVRGKLQMVSFEKAKESAQQFSSEKQREEIESRQAEEHKPPDEAGLVDRKRTKELEEQHANEIDAVAATEKEMIERSKPKLDSQAVSESLQSVVQNSLKVRDSELGATRDEQTKEQNDATATDHDGQENDASKEEGDMNDSTQADADQHDKEHEGTEKQFTAR